MRRRTQIKPFNRPYFRKDTKPPRWFAKFLQEDGSKLSVDTGIEGESNIQQAIDWCWKAYAEGRYSNLRGERIPIFREYFANAWIPGKCKHLRQLEADGKPLSLKTIRHYRQILEAYLFPYLGDKKLNQIKIDDTIPLKEDLKKGGFAGRPLSARTVGGIIKVAKDMLRWAVADKVIQISPLEYTTLPKDDSTPKGILTIEQWDDLFFAEDAIREIWKGRYGFYLIHLLASTTGMRIGEILGLRKLNIHQTDKEAYLRINRMWDSETKKLIPLKEHRTAKHREDKIIPLWRFCYQAMNIWMDHYPWDEMKDEDLLFYGYKRGYNTFNTVSIEQMTRYIPLYSESTNNILKEALLKAGIIEKEIEQKKITNHSWRFFYRSHMEGYFEVAAGISSYRDVQEWLQKHRQRKVNELPMMQEVLGHSSKQMSEHYRRETEEGILNKLTMGWKALHMRFTTRLDPNKPLPWDYWRSKGYMALIQSEEEGQFLVRKLSKDLVRKMKLLADKRNTFANNLYVQAVKEFIEREESKEGIRLLKEPDTAG